MLVIIGLVVSSNFIWNIEIKGEYSFPKEEILQSLEEQGLKIGSNKHKMDSNYIINNIRLKRDDIAWMGITLKGTNVIVEVRETKDAPEIIKEDEYCNIVSNKPGLITKISVQNGTANVKEGDIVKVGDILVNGIVEGKYTGVRYVHSLANIEAKIWYTKKEKIFFNNKVPTETGNIEKKYSVKLNNFKINFYKTLSKFQKYDTISESKKLKIFSDFYLPIEIVKMVNHEQIYEDITYTEEEAIRLGTEKIEKEFSRNPRRDCKYSK